MSASIRVGGEPFQYDSEADAGIMLSTGERWWGTRIKWRPGSGGKWRHFVVRDLHPFDAEGIEAVLVVYLKQRTVPASAGSTERKP